MATLLQMAGKVNCLILVFLTIDAELLFAKYSEDEFL